MNIQFEDDYFLFIVLCLGVMGYVVKGELFVKLKSVIMDVYEGGGFFFSYIVGRISFFFKDIGIVKNLEYILFIKMEQEILVLLCIGMLYKEIVVECYNSFYMIYLYLKSIYKKFYVNLKLEVILKVLNLKFV